MYFLIIALSSLINTSGMAQTNNFGEFKECGEYIVAGIFKMNDKKANFDYIVYQGSKSEIKIKLKMTDVPKAAPYSNRPSLVRAIFRKPIAKQVGEFEILEIKPRIPNPIKGANDSGFNLISAKKCL